MLIEGIYRPWLFNERKTWLGLADNLRSEDGTRETRQLEFVGQSTVEKRAAQSRKPIDVTEDTSWSIL